MRRVKELVSVLAVLASYSCSGGGIGADGAGAGGSGGGGGGGGGNDEQQCRDADGDGFGPSCAAGLDCDDTDPARRDDCSILEVGTDEVPWNPDAASGLEIDEDGALVLGQDTFQDDSVWIANTDEGTVSRIDAKTGREVGRYPSAIEGDNHARPWNEACDSGDHTGNCPSRTAIDFRRDCWVANRAFGNQGTVTKIAAREEDCIDRNGNGVIDTSRDDDGDGRISPGEVRGENDECVLFTVDVAGVNGMPRALAIAPALGDLSAPGGHAWVGANFERRAYQLHGSDGHVMRTVDIPLNPYGALAGKLGGVVWFVNAGWQADVYDDNPPSIVAVDFTTGEVSPRYEVISTIPDCVGTYGITLDQTGRVWTGGSPCEAVFRFDPRDESWLTARLDGRGNTRGLVADAVGRVWVAHSKVDGEAVGNISSVDQETGGDPEYYTMPAGKVCVGVDMDAEGRIWTVNQQTNTAARIDPATGEINEYPVGRKPYSYSDFTGHSLFLQFPQGVYTGHLEACGDLGATWLSASWEGEAPEGSAVEIRIRTAATAEGLAEADWIGPFTENPADLQAPPGPVGGGSHLEYELTLRSLDGAATPRVRSFAITYVCALQ